MILARRRALLSVVWLALATAALYAFLFHRADLQERLRSATSVSMLAGGLVYLTLGSLRGMTLVPATSLVLLGVAFFPPGPLFALTLAGILVSSATIYLFSESLRLDDVLVSAHGERVYQLRQLLRRHELPIIIVWSFFPLAPTDLICYVCGILRVGFAKCLLGVAIGEGAICAIYIFFGDYVLRSLMLK